MENWFLGRESKSRENVEPSSFYQWTKKNFTDASFRGRRSSASFQTRETASVGRNTWQSCVTFYLLFSFHFLAGDSTKLCITELVIFPKKSVEIFARQLYSSMFLHSLIAETINYFFFFFENNRFNDFNPIIASCFNRKSLFPWIRSTIFFKSEDIHRLKVEISSKLGKF